MLAGTGIALAATLFQIHYERSTLKSFYRAIDYPFRKIIFGRMDPFDLYSSLRPEFHSSLKTIGVISREKSKVLDLNLAPITNGIASLRKLQTVNTFYFRHPELLFEIFDVEHLAITHLKLSFIPKWIPIILKLRCLETLEDETEHAITCETSSDDEEDDDEEYLLEDESSFGIMRVSPSAKVLPIINSKQHCAYLYLYSLSYQKSWGIKIS
ncbi:hypothetical protein PPL_05431 [Heterostelium album PN500]|uniref:Uncharacterized protein n=1 Tax=Heterostelium pallidum (strain ATCC 26659 / Pp 5 / PN500) TaxID=670386 RepID=D3BA56_HETP5|nr:hypothetical protein PPL_05431 [Heterostelium album PN500]EFA81443.1 hypothetical protein PPL_05431 [Heterostelium album PN500]|eukprot:XP_020433561.1 hypothetical protein PPL_05431 [Heterostelium album PN500]